MLLPRLRALRGVEVSFRDWLLHAVRQRGRVTRWAIGGLAGLAAACAWVIGLAIIEVTEWFEYSFSKIEIQDHIAEDQWNDSGVAWGVAGLLLVLVPVLIYPLLARRAARRVLIRRHECPRCWHDVRGTPMAASETDGDTLACTECGYRVLARGAWSEVGGVGGRAVFVPAKDLVRPWLSRRAVRALIVCGAVVLALAVLIPAVYWGVREYRIRSWARQAAAAPGYGDQIDALVLQAFPTNPAGVDSSLPSFWTELMTLRRDIEDAERLARDRDKPEDERLAARFGPNLSQVADSVASDASEEDRALWLIEQRSAERVLGDLAKSEVFARVDRLSLLAVHPVPSARGADVDSAMKFGAARSVIRLNEARAAIALRNGNAGEALRAWRSSLEVSRRIAQYPSGFAKLVSFAAYATVYHQMRESLRTQQDITLIDGCLRMIREWDAPASLETTMMLEQAIGKAAITEFFVKEGPRDPDALITPIPIIGTGEGRVGSYAENIEALDAFYDDLTRYTEMPTWSDVPGQSLRGGLFKTSADETLATVKLLDWQSMIVDLWTIQRPLERDGTLLMLAIAKFQAREGRLPAALTELVPGDAAELPDDLWSGKAFQYRVLPEQEANDNATGWAYVLYSVGPDRVDDGGVVWKEGHPLSINAPKGTDNVLTTTEE